MARDKLAPVIAFAKNGSPLVTGANSPGYVDKIALYPGLETDPAFYTVENSGGPLAVFVPSSNPDVCDALSVFGVTSITVDLIPDAYAHLSAPYAGLAGGEVRFYGEGLEMEASLTVGEIESKQRKTKTLDYSLSTADGAPVELRFRGVPVYDLLVEIGVKSNAGDVIFYDSDGSSIRCSLSALKKKNFTNLISPEKEPLTAMLAFGAGLVGENPMTGLPLVASDTAAGYDPLYLNSGGPLKLILPGQTAEDSLVFGNIVAVEVTANEIDSWGHLMSDIYSEFLGFEFTLTVKNDDSEWSHVFTLEKLESMTDLIVRESYSVLDIGECEGLDIWKFVKRFAGGVPGLESPVAVTVYASDGYKNDLLSVFYKEGLELGIADGDGNRKPLIIAYAVNGLPLVDSESHEGYTGLAGNTSGPLRVIAETNQGASVKYVSKLVVTLPGSGALEPFIDQSLLIFD